MQGAAGTVELCSSLPWDFARADGCYEVRVMMIRPCMQRWLEVMPSSSSTSSSCTVALQMWSHDETAAAAGVWIYFRAREDVLPNQEYVDNHNCKAATGSEVTNQLALLSLKARALLPCLISLLLHPHVRAYPPPSRTAQ